MKKLLLLTLLFVSPAFAVETIGLTKSITMSGTTYPNAFANIKIVNIPGTGLDLGVMLSVYTDQAYAAANPNDPLFTKTFTINVTALQHETIFNTLYTRLVSQVSILNGATQVVP